MASTKKLTSEETFFIPPEGVARITGEVTYSGRYYEYQGDEIVGQVDTPLVQAAGVRVPKLGKLVQAVDDGDPTTPVWYEVYDGDEADYEPVKRTDDYAQNVQKFITGADDRKPQFAGHPEEPEEGPKDAPRNDEGGRSPHYTS